MLRVLPWITDGAIDFLDTFILERRKIGFSTKVFEFGSGNSTLYFLSKGCFVTSVEHDTSWAKKIIDAAHAFEYQDRLNLIESERPYDGCYEDDGISITVIDGRDRVMCFERVLSKIKNKKQIIVLDNTERMDYKYSEYISLIKKHGLSAIHFEQHQLEHEGRRFTTRSYARDRVYHRHITTICFLEGMYTTDGKALLRNSTWD
jgi:hypothetical protein